MITAKSLKKGNIFKIGEVEFVVDEMRGWSVYAIETGPNRDGMAISYTSRVWETAVLINSVDSNLEKAWKIFSDLDMTTITRREAFTRAATQYAADHLDTVLKELRHLL